MNPLRSMASHRVYVRQGPEPVCPLHGRLTWTLGGYRCQWTASVDKKDGYGYTYRVTERCEYRDTDRRETVAEPWEEPDEGITFGTT